MELVEEVKELLRETAKELTDVKLTKVAMDAVETQLQRLLSLGKWFVDIAYRVPDLRDG